MCDRLKLLFVLWFKKMVVPWGSTLSKLALKISYARCLALLACGYLWLGNTSYIVYLWLLFSLWMPLCTSMVRLHILFNHLYASMVNCIFYLIIYCEIAYFMVRLHILRFGVRYLRPCWGDCYATYHGVDSLSSLSLMYESFFIESIKSSDKSRQLQFSHMPFFVLSHGVAYAW